MPYRELVRTEKAPGDTAGGRGVYLNKTDLVPILGRLPFLRPPPEAYLHFGIWLFQSLIKISFKGIFRTSSVNKLPLSSL